MSNKIILALGIICLILAFFLFKSCNSHTSVTPSGKSEVDSIVNKAISDSLKLGKVIDSIQDENAWLALQNDSLTKEITITKADLQAKGNAIIGIIDDYNASKTTPDSLRNCDSLVSEVLQAKGLVALYENQNDSLGRLTAKLLANKDTIILRLNSAYGEANNQLFETSRLYNNLSVDYKKAIKSANKRWSAGPFAGVSVVGGKFAPIVGAGVTYSLLKF